MWECERERDRQGRMRHPAAQSCSVSGVMERSRMGGGVSGGERVQEYIKGEGTKSWWGLRCRGAARDSLWPARPLTHSFCFLICLIMLKLLVGRFSPYSCRIKSVNSFLCFCMCVWVHFCIIRSELNRLLLTYHIKADILKVSNGFVHIIKVNGINKM